MKIFAFKILPIAIFVLGISSCQSNSKSELEKINLLRGELVVCGTGQFGEVSFPFNGKNSVKATFNNAIALLHSFEYEEAEKAFVKVLDEDPNCAMAYWGVAMCTFHVLWAPPGEEDLKKGNQLLAIANDLKKSEIETEYLDAISAYYNDWENKDHKTRAKAMELKMENMHKKYPEDIEIAVFYALTLNSTADPKDKAYTNQLKAGKILEALAPKYPNHPGIAHYIIHTYDYPELAELALPTARAYSSIAPASAHAQHMPSHIFTRLGLWQESINSNANSASSARCYAEKNNLNAHWSREIHALDYLFYAYLQQGNSAKVEQETTYFNSIDKVLPGTGEVAYPFASIPSRLVLETKNWAEATKVQPKSSDIDWDLFPWEIAMIHFARAIGAANLKDVKTCGLEIDTLKMLQQKLVAKNDAYKANQVMIQIKSAEAWHLLAKGKAEQAIPIMLEAAIMEDNTSKHPITPGEVLPARELLGDMYFQTKKYAKALEAYEDCLKTHPNRFNSISGAAQASEKLGNKEKASAYYLVLQDLQNKYAGNRKEFDSAKAYLAQKS